MRKEEQQQRQRECRGSKHAIANLPTLTYVYGGGPKNGRRKIPRLSTIHYSSLFVSARNEYGLKKSLMDIAAFEACGVSIILAGDLQ